MSEEWGPWIEHDGKGCPCRGEYVQGKFDDDRPDAFGIAYGVLNAESAWLWENAHRVAVLIRYRIRKPKGLTTLESLLTNLPQLEDA